MKLTDEQIEQMALDKYPYKEFGFRYQFNLQQARNRWVMSETLKQARDIYEKEIQRLNLEILTMTGTIDELRDELKIKMK